jgi:hypothetical protein
MNAPVGRLFRPEVAEARKQRVYGEIVVTQPVRTRAPVLLIFSIATMLGLWVALGTYSAVYTFSIVR